MRRRGEFVVKGEGAGGAWWVVVLLSRERFELQHLFERQLSETQR